MALCWFLLMAFLFSRVVLREPQVLFDKCAQISYTVIKFVDHTCMGLLQSLRECAASQKGGGSQWCLLNQPYGKQETVHKP